MGTLKFEELNLSKDVLKAISSMGFEQTTPIQSKAIPEILLFHDVIGQASTGTGKTAAFGLPAIERIDESSSAVQVLVLCPTRELAIQVSSEMNKFLKHKKNISALPIYGGQPIERQLFGLRKKPKIVIGTPGRILDHIKRGTLNLSKVKIVVLDEADVMLDMGFRQDINQILNGTPRNRQTVLFSATISHDILSLTKRFQTNPKMIRVVDEDIHEKMIEQSYFDIEPSRKTRLLTQLLIEYSPRLSIVFCNTRRKVDVVCNDLRDHGFRSAAIHGEIRQNKRDNIMKKFRNEKVNILVATDVAARGLDISNVEVVFNYGIPRETESYVHRIGRTGRAGKTGKAISLVSREEFRKFRDIMRYTKVDIERKKIKNYPELDMVFDYNEKSKKKTSPKTNNNCCSKQNKFFEQINNRIKRTSRGISSEYFLMMKDLVHDNNSLENVSAALLKMVVEGEDKSRMFSQRRFR